MPNIVRNRPGCRAREREQDLLPGWQRGDWFANKVLRQFDQLMADHIGDYSGMNKAIYGGTEILGARES